MADILNLVLVAMALPLLAAFLGQVLAHPLGRRVVRLSIGISVVVLILTGANLYLVLSRPELAQVLAPSEMGVMNDALGALMAFVIAAISTVVHIYSRRYMADERGYARFFVLLDLITAALLVLVLVGNLVAMLVAWHLIGVLLYFLLGFDLRSRTAQRYAFWTLFTYRLGDLPLVAAAVVLYHAYGSWSLPEIFSAILAGGEPAQFLGVNVPGLVAFLIALAAFARSAQFLVHTWLPYTMGGPTPVSALMHAGIVNVGGFMVNRFAPVFVHAGEVLNLMLIVGLVTAVIGSVLMLAQSDIKKALGYSTMGQMGFMIMECGVGAFSLAIFHMVAHGVFKGTLFLGSGGVIHDARRNDGVPKKDLYTFVVERPPEHKTRPWLFMAAFTLIVPVGLLFLSHYAVDTSFMQKQGAVILLFFGWIAGAQVIFSTYRMRATNPVRTFALVLLSFVVVVVGYSVVANAFDSMLYPDETFRKQIYKAAAIDPVYFNLVAALVTAVFVGGWLLAYFAERKRIDVRDWHRQVRRKFHGVISHEFYVGDIYSAVARWLVLGAERTNTLLRWR